ncbi:MAG: glutamine-hydrolyzing GMP synthase [Exilispira sp.]
MNLEKVIVIDFGGQYSQLIARRIREANVYSQILPFNTPVEKIIDENPVAIIFSGGPSSVYEKNSPAIDSKIFDFNIPILGICYGAQLIAKILGGNVKKSDTKEYGKVSINIKQSTIFENIPSVFNVWMSHTDFVEILPQNFINTSFTDYCPNSSFEDKKRNIYALQFHPEVYHTEYGFEIIKNFLYKVAKCSGNWSIDSYLEDQIQIIKDEVKDEKVICALSGGVDSTVAANLVAKAIGNNLICIFVDHGLLRKGEKEEIHKNFSNRKDLNFLSIDAKEIFLKKLKNISDPEKKRKIIGKTFIEIFNNEAKKLKGIKYLVQGTIYPDIVESGTNTSATIKSHHNVGGLPEKLNFKLIEPLKYLFKDEVRILGKKLNLADEFVYRQPFPGPGLAIRIIGKINETRLNILKEADYILRDEIKKANLDSKIWQYFAVLTGIKTVGVMGDNRTYSELVAIRAVESVDGMTADWYKIPYDILEKISRRIVNQVPGINRVVFDITSKPPSTIEWE